MADPIIVNSQTLEKTFDEAAPLYDGGGVFRKSGQRLVDLLNLRPGSRVMDVATGAGAVLLPAARQVGSAGQVTGIDISANMLQRTRQAAAAEGLANVELLKMDGGYLQFPDASFDIVTCGFGIFFLAETALKEIYRVCRPGGTVGLTVFSKTVAQESSPGTIFGKLTKEYGIELKFSMPLPASYEPEEIESLLASHGFVQIQTVKDTRETVYADFEEYWKTILGSGNRTVIMSMDEGTLERFKSDLFERMRPIMRPEGISALFSVLYVTARK